MRIGEDAKKMLEKANVYEVECSVAEYPEDERDGRDDFQMLADEAGYVFSCYLEDGHVLHNSLKEARRKLYETRYGKVIPVDSTTFKPLKGYTPSDVQNAKDIVNEYNRTRRFLLKLENMGYYSQWV